MAEMFKKKWLPFLYGAGAGLLVFVIAEALFNPVIVNGESMEPTYYNGNILSCEKITSTTDIKRGDVAVIITDRRLIKRVVAIPGDTVTVKDGVLYVNGEESPYQYETIRLYGILQSGPITLRENEYFAMGDNRNHSYDCREFGPVSIENIKLIVKKRIL